MSVWQDELKDFLLQIGSTSFAFQRNQLHYDNNVWLLNDLHNPLIIPGYGIKNNFLEELPSLKENSDNFSFVLSQVLLLLATQLLKDLGKLSSTLQMEYDLVEDKLKRDVFHIFNNNCITV